MGLKDAAFVQNTEQEAIPDYWSYPYSANKHWTYANDPFYANPTEWIDSSPKGYDDYVRLQTRTEGFPGVTFLPGRRSTHQSLQQVEVPDYWSYPYSANRHWEFAGDPYYADPEEWVSSAPKAYEALLQVQSRGHPGVTFYNQDNM